MIFDEFRTSQQNIEKLRLLIKQHTTKDITIMEVCGTHTMSIFKYGIRDMLPCKIKLISGPGCPVCVTENSVIDKMIWLSKQNDIIIATFGDMLRVPGSYSSLYLEKASGADIRIVYSPLLALELAKKNPDKKVVFIAVGFETTIPAIAVTLKKAKNENVRNFFILCAHKTVPAALEAIAIMPNKVDGFLLPGHVSSIIGSKAYAYLAKKHNMPGVIAGFEPVDLLQAIYSLILMIESSDIKIINEYGRIVSYEGNIKAQNIIGEVFDISDASWRGIGVIAGSGLKLNNKFDSYDIEKAVDIKINAPKEPEGCLCGKILCGTKLPTDCVLFGKKCVPENPAGPCMVSTEGTCAAYYKYNHFERKDL